MLKLYRRRKYGQQQILIRQLKKTGKIFSTEEHKDKTLEYGIHTVKVRAMGEKNASASRDKVELDAFNVLNTEAARVEKVEVASASGMTTVSKAGSTLPDESGSNSCRGDQ